MKKVKQVARLKEGFPLQRKEASFLKACPFLLLPSFLPSPYAFLPFLLSFLP
ncbi:hypothetical protein DPMN_143776 [Dreissena polymorpha]|uniref:Uncharacterized protein n=1 Tax=Dreissena polymorpha TaxID=45954 RepID=A0A9D4JLZ3_DREPO|nr:hypothetical protein DPMN_143776 [Dreissena polymorpha]